MPPVSLIVSFLGGLMNITINNSIGLLEELLHNGDSSKTYLYAWFIGERELIKRTVIDLRDYENEQATEH